MCSCVGGYFGDECATAHFEWLSENFTVNAISADGQVVVGAKTVSTTYVPARWTHASGVAVLNSLSSALDVGSARAVSADGSVIVGEAGLVNGSGPFRWTAADGLVLLIPDSAGGATGSAVSADGKTVGGVFPESETVPVRHAFRWTAAGGVEDSATLGVNGEVRGMSGDGTVLVGFYAPDGTSFASAAFFWTHPSGASRIGTNAGFAAGISRDGNVVVGADTDAGTLFIYNMSAQRLDHLALDGFDNVRQPAINGDGTVIVGLSTQGSWIWDAEHGGRVLDDVLAESGVDATQWNSLSVSAIAADGKTLTGNAYKSIGGVNGPWTSWVARL